MSKYVGIVVFKKNKNINHNLHTHIEQQGWYWCVALHMDHGQNIGQMTLPRSYKEQPERKKKNNYSTTNTEHCNLSMSQLR